MATFFVKSVKTNYLFGKFGPVSNIPV